MKKIISISLIALLLVSCFTFAAGALNKVNIRIEGKDSTFFNGSVYVGANATVLDAVTALDNANESLDVSIVDSGWGAYISGINGDNEVTESVTDPTDPDKVTSYYIGWMFAVNNQSSSDGVSDYVLHGGDDIVFYYVDMYSQVPVADFSETGKIKLTSYDTDWSTYTSDWMPVVGATVVLDGKEYISDENGYVTYNPEDFDSIVNVQIYRFDEVGYPTVARFAENYAFMPVAPEAPKTVTLNYNSSLYVKETYKIDIATDEDVTATSSNEKVATVNSDGKITAKKAGKATITVKAGSVIAKYKITVKNPKLNVSSKTLKKGKSFSLKVTGAVGSVKYSTNKKSVAAVNSKGKVTAKKAGKATITVKANGVALTCKITVK